jgi:hypothetical protein
MIGCCEAAEPIIDACACPSKPLAIDLMDLCMKFRKGYCSDADARCEAELSHTKKILVNACPPSASVFPINSPFIIPCT